MPTALLKLPQRSFENYWMKPITSYLKDGVLPEGKEATRKLKV